MAKQAEHRIALAAVFETAAKSTRLHINTSNGICNNDCLFCKDDKSQDKKYFLSMRSFLDIVGNEAVSGSRDIVFSGGEPTLNPLLPEFVRKIKSLGTSRICLISNGRRLADRDFCLELLESGVNDITISLHGHRPKLHDFITTREGSFSESAAALDNLAELSSDFDFELNTATVVNRINLNFMDSVMRYIGSRKVDRMIFNVVDPAQRAEENFSVIVPAYSEIAVVFDRLSGLSKELSVKRGVEVRLEGLPLCVRRGNISYSGPREKQIETCESDVVTGETKKPQYRERAKFVKCGRCEIRAECEGVYINYLKRCGDSEFSPLGSIPDGMKKQFGAHGGSK